MNYFDYLKNMTVLLAEDDEIIRNSIVNVLDIFVSRVIAVGDGEAALDVFENGGVDIIILDIGMPKINGMEVARKIREKDCKTPIFIITSFNDTGSLQDAIPLMLVEYLIKPIRFDQIKKALSKSMAYIDKQGGLSYKIDTKTTYNKLSGKITYSTGDEANLPKREKLLFDLLIRNKNKILLKNYLEDFIFDLNCTESSLKNLVYRLKKKIPANLIVNVRDIGYMLIDKK